MSKTTLIVTSYKEAKTIGKAIGNIIDNLSKIDDVELIVVSPDQETIDEAKKTLSSQKDFKDWHIIKDKAEGKPQALNLAVQKAKGGILFLTDGDMYLEKDAIAKILKHFENKETGGVGGHPVSKDNKNDRFGYYSHLFCEAAHQRRLIDNNVPMSGYIYAFRNIKGLFPIPPEIRAEDAYTSAKLLEMGYKLEYEPNSLASVSFPKNKNDWIRQKLRSLGGNVQIKHKRSIVQDIKFGLFPIKYAKNLKELGWSIALYPLRLQLWLMIYKQHLTKTYSKGVWERIESSKTSDNNL